MFIDASALCAILLGEPEGPELARRIEDSAVRLTSPIAVMETALALLREGRETVESVRVRIASALKEADIQIVSIGAPEADAALDAHGRFGKGRHPARLNMGDCFAYACARTNGAPLLFKGEDFAQTDVAHA